MKFKKRENTFVSPSFIGECSKEFNISPLVMERIILRGNDTKEKIKEFLNPSNNSFHDPFLLKGMKELVERIKLAVAKKERVLIFGDYDVDGVSATAIMLKTLKIMGAEPKYYLPNRYVDGYGLTNDVLKKIKKEYNPSLIITVDCGISCAEEVDFAKTIGIEVVVTDHHEIPPDLPNTIVVNAKLPDQKYGFNGLCGTGLAYKISTALIGKKSEEFLPIACVATVADIVPLLDENRAIVYHGIKKLAMLPLGIRSLIKKLKINISKCTSNEISYKIAPKLNASGRMGDAQDSLKLFLSENPTEIKVLIDKILQHNENRKELCNVVENDCKNVLTKISIDAPSIILASKDWDQGILGIICAKLVSQYNRPVFLFSEIDGEMKGSARSIFGVNIHTLLASMSDILESYGGHPIAAGLTIKSENFNEFVKRVNAYLLENIDSEVFIPYEEYDMEIKVNDITQKLLNDLKFLEPCGCDNDSIKFLISTSNYGIKPMDKYPNHCNIKIGNKLNLVYFNFLKDANKLKFANNLKILFEMQTEQYSQNLLKGIVKVLDCDYFDLKQFSKISVLPYLENLKYLQAGKKAKFTFYNEKETRIFNVSNMFGTAFVVNSDFGYRMLKTKVKEKDIAKLDFGVGEENSGINTVFICPPSIDFARSYNRIIFLDTISDFSYIAKINEISDAEVFLPNMKYQQKFFNGINIERNRFLEIYKNIKNFEGKYYNYLNLYMITKKTNASKYSYKEFYCAMMVFEELKIVNFEKFEGMYHLSFNKVKTTDLSKSLIYKRLSQILSTT